MQRIFERLAQALQKVQRAAQKQHLALDAPALRQPRHRLVHHRLKDAGGDVFLLRALVEQRLDIRLGEHAAAGGDGVHLFRLEREFVHLPRGDVQKGRHLVDEGARAARAAAVHALLGAAGDEDDLGVFAAQLDGGVGVGVVFADGGERRLHFLHEGDAAALGKAQARRTRDADVETAAELFGDHGQLPQHALFDAREVPLVAGI